MAQDLTAFRKISFQTVDVEVALAEIEYQFLKFICEATLRNSDEVLREQIRHLKIAELPSFDDWRKQGTTPARLLPAIETSTIPTTAIESHDDAVETTVQPYVKPSTDWETLKAGDRKPAEPSSTAKASKTKQPTSPTTGSATTGSATDKLVNALSEPALAKLTSREVIEQTHELLSAALKEGKSHDDLAVILTSHGAKISASTLRNYISAARRLAKTAKAGKATKPRAAKAVEATATLPIVEQSTDKAAVSVESVPVAASESVPPAVGLETTPAPAKPKRGRPKAAAKTKVERETSVKTGRAPKSSSLEATPITPAPRRRKTKG